MNYNCSNCLDLRNLQEQIKRHFVKLSWPFRINCSSDLKNFANSSPSASNFKSFSRSQEQFFLTVGQKNFGNKIPFLKSSFWSGRIYHSYNPSNILAVIPDQNSRKIQLPDQRSLKTPNNMRLRALREYINSTYFFQLLQVEFCRRYLHRNSGRKKRWIPAIGWIYWHWIEKVPIETGKTEGFLYDQIVKKSWVVHSS